MGIQFHSTTLQGGIGTGSGGGGAMKITIKPLNSAGAARFASLSVPPSECYPPIASLYLPVSTCLPLPATLYLPPSTCLPLLTPLYLPPSTYLPLSASIYLPYAPSYTHAHHTFTHLRPPREQAQDSSARGSARHGRKRRRERWRRLARSGGGR